MGLRQAEVILTKPCFSSFSDFTFFSLSVCNVSKQCIYHKMDQINNKNEKKLCIYKEKIDCIESTQFHQHFTSSFCGNIILPKGVDFINMFRVRFSYKFWHQAET
jgi:hypothetical protein